MQDNMGTKELGEENKECTKNNERKMMKPKSPRPAEYVKSGGRKAKGSRHSRRYDNLNFLLTLVDNEEFGDVEMADLIEPSVSAFAELLSEKEKMKVWSEFINRSEEDQAVFLQCQCYPDVQVHHDDSDDDGWTKVDSRADHPAFSADECFRRIDGKVRSMLQRRQLPKGILVQLENDLTSFFREWPDSIYIQAIPNSYERMLLHAICQYLDLKSRSLYVEKYKHTQVENTHTTFTPPTVPLSTYVESVKH